MIDKREAIRDCFDANPHRAPSPDAILNALHQSGWAVVPRSELAKLRADLERAERA